MADNQNNAVLRQVMDAAYFAAEKHVMQRRKGMAGEPYVNHLLEVAALVANATEEPDVNAVMAGLLHDCIEDVGVTKAELEGRFGSQVAGIVAEVTDDKTLKKEERKRLQVENASKKSASAALVKLADKVSNLRAMLNSPPADWSEERRTKYFAWAKEVVERLPAPNPRLKAEFDELQRRFSVLGAV